jgi:hypothetical protein
MAGKTHPNTFQLTFEGCVLEYDNNLQVCRVPTFKKTPLPSTQR